MTSESSPSGHLSPATIAAYVDGGLPEVERRRADAHLADCPHCTGELVAVSELADAAGAAPRQLRPSRVAAALLAAAVVLLVVRVSVTAPNASDVATDDLRAPAGPAVSEGVQRLDAIGPGATARVRAESLAFSWRPLDGDVAYQLTVSDASGTRVWDTTTHRAGAALPAAVARTLRVGQAYYWRVDAMLPDLGSASTGERRVTIVR